MVRSYDIGSLEAIGGIGAHGEETGLPARGSRSGLSDVHALRRSRHTAGLCLVMVDQRIRPKDRPKDADTHNENHCEKAG